MMHLPLLLLCGKISSERKYEKINSRTTKPPNLDGVLGNFTNFIVKLNGIRDKLGDHWSVSSSLLPSHFPKEEALLVILNVLVWTEFAYGENTNHQNSF